MSLEYNHNRSISFYSRHRGFLLKFQSKTWWAAQAHLYHCSNMIEILLAFLIGIVPRIAAWPVSLRSKIKYKRSLCWLAFSVFMAAIYRHVLVVSTLTLWHSRLIVLITALLAGYLTACHITYFRLCRKSSGVILRRLLSPQVGAQMVVEELQLAHHPTTTVTAL